MNTIPLGTLTLRCPSCGSSDQFIQSGDLNENSPDADTVACLCGATTTVGTLRLNAKEEAMRLVAEAVRNALGK